MKGLLNKEHYCYKIYILLMKTNAPPFYRHPLPIRITPPFLQEDLEHPPFQKSQPPINKRGSYYGYSVSFFSFNISIFSVVNSKYERKFQKKSKTTFSRSAQGVGRYNSFSRSCSKINGKHVGKN